MPSQVITSVVKNIGIQPVIIPNDTVSETDWNVSDWFDRFMPYIALLRGFTRNEEREQTIKQQLIEQNFRYKDAVLAASYMKYSAFTQAKIKFGVEITDFLRDAYTITKKEAEAIYLKGWYAGRDYGVKTIQSAITTQNHQATTSKVDDSQEISSLKEEIKLLKKGIQGLEKVSERKDQIIGMLKAEKELLLHNSKG